MSEEFSNGTEVSGAEQTRSEAHQAWEEVGHQFKHLGESLAVAFSALWESEESQQHFESLRDGLQSLANEVSAAVSKAASAPETQEVKSEAHKAAESARTVVEKAAEEARPQITSALKQVDAELQKLIKRLEAGEDAD